MKPIPLPILEYHGVERAPAGARQAFLYVGLGKFRRQMELLRLLGINVVTVSRGLELLNSNSRGRFVAVTFDDAYRDVFLHALPVLRRLDFTATCYAVSDRLGQHNTWDAATLNVRKPIMSAAELTQWAAAGMEVGGHTRTHARLTECSDFDLEHEVRGGKLALEHLLGRTVTQFCYPYGDYDERVRAAVVHAGYDAAVTTRRGRAHAGDDRFALPRVPVHGNRSLAVFPFRTLTAYADKHR